MLTLKKRSEIQRIPARQDNGMPVTLVPKSFIEDLQVEHTCESGEEKTIEGVVYIGVTTLKPVMGIT